MGGAHKEIPFFGLKDDKSSPPLLDPTFCFTKQSPLVFFSYSALPRHINQLST